jgi:transcriptional regulator
VRLVYVPGHFAISSDEAWDLLASIGSGHLVSVCDGIAHATLLPLSVRTAGDGTRSIIAHFARGNPQWRTLSITDQVLLVAAGPQAYVSPGFYPSKRETGKVVPTWNYVEVQVRGSARLIEEDTELLGLVHELTDRFESDRDDPWSVADAPPDFIAGQLRAIVGIEVTVDSIEGKAKLSQNRTDMDRIGVRDGLSAAPGAGPAVAELMSPDRS